MANPSFSITVGSIPVRKILVRALL